MSDTDWQAIRFAYEGTDEPFTEIARRNGINPVTIRRRAAVEGWSRRPWLDPGEGGAPDVAALVAALQRTAARLVAVMEARLKTAGAAVDEQEVRALGTLAATLAKVIALDPRRSRRDAAAPDGDAAGDDRAELDALVALAERFVAARPDAGLPGRAADGAQALPEPLLAAPGADGPADAAG